MHCIAPRLTRFLCDRVVALIAPFILSLPLSVAAAFPERPIHIVVPYPPGGSADILARLLGTHMGIDFGWQVITDNRPGAAGITGTVAVARAPGDGYTLVLASGATHGAFLGLYPNLPYHPERDFTPISNMATLTSVLVIHPSVPARSVRELIAYAKANPGRLAFGSGGNGSAAHLAMEMFNFGAGLKMLHVPYKGNPPALQDLIAGQVQVMIANMPSVIGFLQQGNRLVGLAVAGPKRDPVLKDLPTIAEAALPGFNADVWQGVLAAANTPQVVVTTLNQAMRKIMGKPEVQAELDRMGAVRADNSPAEFAREIREGIRVYGDLITALGLKAD